MGTYLESSQIFASSKLCLTNIYPRLPVMWQRKAENRLIFGIFEWAQSTTGDITVARTMAIQALVAARVIYLLSIGQLGKSLVAYLRRRSPAIVNSPILLMGIVVAIALQILFSQWGVMNFLFNTAPLTWQQWLICLLPMVPMVPVAILANRIDPS